MSESGEPRPHSPSPDSESPRADENLHLTQSPKHGEPVESPSEVYQRWRSGEVPDAREEIDRRRTLGVDVGKTEFVDLAYEAYAACIEQGLPVDPRCYPDQFPTFHESVRRSIEVHQYVESELGPAVPMEDQIWPEVGDQILDFELIEMLGAGVRARAFLARNVNIGDRVEVVKVARTEDSFDEAESQGRLNHENIAPVLHVKHDPVTDLTVIAMPYLGRVTLADVIREFLKHDEWPTQASSILSVAKVDGIAATTKPLLSGSYLDAAMELGRQIAAGLAAAHDEGVIHGDIKTSNVLVTPDGRAMLLDFNLAQDEHRQWQLPRVGGTLPYLATEQLRSRRDAQAAFTEAKDKPDDVEALEEQVAATVRANRQTDLFSLGVVLYELFTGQYPFSPWPDFEQQPLRAFDELLSRHEQGPDAVNHCNPEAGETAAAIVSACLSPDPRRRPATANEVVQAIRQAQLERKLDLHEQRARQEEKNRQAAEKETRSLAARQAFGWAAVGATLMSAILGTWLWLSAIDPASTLPVTLRFETPEEAIEGIRQSYWADQLGDAIRQNKAALVQHEGHLRLYAIYAELLRSLNPLRRESLLPHYEKACQGEFEVRAWSNLASLLVRHRDRHQEAIRMIDQCVQKDDSYWQPHFTYAKIAATNNHVTTPAKELAHIIRGLELLTIDQRKPYHYKLALTIFLRNQQYGKARDLLTEARDRGIKRDQQLDRLLAMYDLARFPWHQTVVLAMPTGSNGANMYEGMLLPPKELLQGSLPNETLPMVETPN